MSNNEINHLDPDDIGLQEVMGNRFQDATRQPMVEASNTLPRAFGVVIISQCF